MNVYDSSGGIIKTIEGNQTEYYISNRELEAEEFARLVRGHWVGICGKRVGRCGINY